jgi:hypothetical protein
MLSENPPLVVHPPPGQRPDRVRLGIAFDGTEADQKPPDF